MVTLIPIAVLACTAVCAAGLVPGVAPAVAIALLAAALMRPLPPGTRPRLFFWISALLLGWIASTTFSLGVLPSELHVQQWRIFSDWAVPHNSLAGPPQGALGRPRMSLHAVGTGRWLFLALGAWGMYWLCVSLNLRQRLNLMKGLVVLGALIGMGGIATWYIWPAGERIWWWYPVAEIGGGNALGPFVNRNHFAAFCAVLAPLALTLVAVPSRRAMILVRGRSGHIEELWLTRGLLERLGYGLCLLVLLAATLLSRSRGGTAAILIGLTTAALLWLRSGQVTGFFAMLLGIGALLLVVFWPDPELQNRLHGLSHPGSALGARWHVWADALRVWRLSPWIGCGMGAFRMVFLQVTPWATGQEATHAESDVLQTLAESGVIGVVLFGALAAAWLNMTAGTGFAGTRHLLTFGMRPGDQRSGNGGDGDTSWHTDGIPYALGVAVAGSVAAIAFQSLVEIPLRIPLIAWTLAALIALIAPLVSSRRRDWLVRVRCMWPERLVLTAALTCLAWSCWRAPGWAWFYRDRQAWLTAADSIEISHFLSVTPGSWNAWFELGDRLFGEQTQLDAKTDSIKAGWHALEQSVQCNPRSLALRNYLAWRYWDAGRRDEARHHRDAYMALAGTDPSVLERWQAAEWDAGYRDAARELVDQYALRGLDDVRASRMLLWLARKELAVGSVARARECLARALDATPADTRVIKLLAKCERRLGYHEREYELLERLVAFDDDGDVWWRIAQLQRDKGNGEKLKHALGMAVRCDGRKRREADQMWAAFILGGTGATSPEIRENNH